MTMNYDVWKKQGLFKPPRARHYGFIEALSKNLELSTTSVKSPLTAGERQMTQNLENLGFSVVPFGQGLKICRQQELMKLTLKRKSPSGHPVLRWMLITSSSAPTCRQHQKDRKKSTEKSTRSRHDYGADRAIRCGNDTGEACKHTRTAPYN